MVQTSFILPRPPQRPTFVSCQVKRESLTGILTLSRCGALCPTVQWISSCLLALTKLVFCFKVKFIQNSIFYLSLTSPTSVEHDLPLCQSHATPLWSNEKVGSMVKIFKNFEITIVKNIKPCMGSFHRPGPVWGWGLPVQALSRLHPPLTTSTTWSKATESQDSSFTSLLLNSISSEEK